MEGDWAGIERGEKKPKKVLTFGLEIVLRKNDRGKYDSYELHVTDLCKRDDVNCDFNAQSLAREVVEIIKRDIGTIPMGRGTGRTRSIESMTTIERVHEKGFERKEQAGVTGSQMAVIEELGKVGTIKSIIAMAGGATDQRSCDDLESFWRDDEKTEEFRSVWFPTSGTCILESPKLDRKKCLKLSEKRNLEESNIRFKNGQCIATSITKRPNCVNLQSKITGTDKKSFIDSYGVVKTKFEGGKCIPYHIDTGLLNVNVSKETCEKLASDPEIENIGKKFEWTLKWTGQACERVPTNGKISTK